MVDEKRERDGRESISLSIAAIGQLLLLNQHKIQHLIAVVLQQSNNYLLSKKYGCAKVPCTRKGTKQHLNDGCPYSPTTRSKIGSVVNKIK